MLKILEEFKNGIEELKIGTGDIVYVGSDITQLLVSIRKRNGIKTKKDQNTFLSQMIDTLQMAVGESGTLLFPVYSWDFCKGKPFDVKNSLGAVGYLNNWVMMNRSDFCRTSHPIYSFMVWGNDCERLQSMDNQEAWGADSPFAYLRENRAKLLLINVSLQRVGTFMHYVEQNLEVPYRYHKYFLGEYTDVKGRTTSRCYSMYVRDLRIECEEYLPDSFMEDANLVKSISKDDIYMKVLNFGDMYDVIADDLLNNKGKNCYHFTNYEINWGSNHTHSREISDCLPL